MSGWSRSEPDLIEMWTGHHSPRMVWNSYYEYTLAKMMLSKSVQNFKNGQTFLIQQTNPFFLSSEPPPTTPGQPGEEEEEENGQPGASSSGNQPSGDNRPQSSASRPNSGSSNSNSNRDSGSNFRSPQGVRLVG